MAIKSYQNKRPERLKDLMMVKSLDGHVTYYLNITKLMIDNLWSSQTELEAEFVAVITQSVTMYNPMIAIPGQTAGRLPTTAIVECMLNNYGGLLLRSKLFDYFEKWDGDTTDITCLQNVINNFIQDVIIRNRYKWVHLYESTVLEFNPLYNVDATEETTRTLEQDGTITDRKTGSDTNAHSGTIADAKTGKDTLKKTGTDTLEYEGSETTEYSGDEKMSYEGSEDVEYTGTEVTADAGTETHTKGGTNTSTTSRTTTESTSWYDAEKTVDQPTETDTLSFDHRTNEKQFQNRKDSTSYTDRQDIKSFDNRADTKSFDDRADARTLNLEDEQSYASTNTRTHNNTDTLTHNTTDTETRDLTDTERVLLRRFGNIGVTQSTQLLENFRNFVSYRILDIVASDIAEALTQGVY